MISAVDTSVILDVLSGRSPFCDVSQQSLRRARAEGKLIICECVLAEVYPALDDEQLFIEFLQDWQLHFEPSSSESAILAGKYFARYLQRGGEQKQVLPDFLIGAHAQVLADRLLARDRGYFRDYFTALAVIDPSK